MTDPSTGKTKFLLHDIRKYLDYFVERKGFTVERPVGNPSDQAVRAAGLARGDDRGPALIIHGIMQRSGTVYVGELLRRHPQIYAYSHQLWEFPALQLTPDIVKLQREFLLGYRLNWGKLGEGDFLPLIGAALIAYLYEPVPPDKRVLAKMPSVQHLNHFFTMFPHENLLILVRDGRDLVHSTLRTWPYLNFIQVCLRWNRSAQMIVNAASQFSKTHPDRYWMARYEDALNDPETFVRTASRKFELDEGGYPFHEIVNIRVIGSSKLEKGASGEVSWQHLKRPRSFRPTQYWKNWSRLRKSIFKVLAGRPLMDLGYCKDLSW